MGRADVQSGSVPRAGSNPHCGIVISCLEGADPQKSAV